MPERNEAEWQKRRSGERANERVSIPFPLPGALDDVAHLCSNRINEGSHSSQHTLNE